MSCSMRSKACMTRVVLEGLWSSTPRPGSESRGAGCHADGGGFISGRDAENRPQRLEGDIGGIEAIDAISEVGAVAMYSITGCKGRASSGNFSWASVPCSCATFALDLNRTSASNSSSLLGSTVALIVAGRSSSSSSSVPWWAVCPPLCGGGDSGTDPISGWTSSSVLHLNLMHLWWSGGWRCPTFLGWVESESQTGLNHFLSDMERAAEDDALSAFSFRRMPYPDTRPCSVRCETPWQFKESGKWIVAWRKCTPRAPIGSARRQTMSICIPKRHRHAAWA